MDCSTKICGTSTFNLNFPLAQSAESNNKVNVVFKVKCEETYTCQTKQYLHKRDDH